MLQEQPFLDTGATPQWQVTLNNTLNDSVTFDKFVPVGPTLYTPTDTAPPVLGYTLAVAGKKPGVRPFLRTGLPAPREPRFFPGLHLHNCRSSAPAHGRHHAGTAVGQRIAEAVLTLDRAILPEDLLLPTKVNIGGGARDAAANGLVIPVGHRISDIGLGLLGNSLYEPVWAKDQTLGAATPGLGYVNVFDGTTWLGDRQVLTIEAHLQTLGTMPALYPAAGATSMVYDIDAAASLKNPSGLWLPGFSDNTSVIGGYSGLVPTDSSGNIQAQTAAELVPTAAQIRTSRSPAAPPGKGRRRGQLPF